MLKDKKAREKVSILKPVKGEAYIQLVWRKFKRSRTAIIGGVLIAIIAVLAIFAPFFSPYDPLKCEHRASFSPPQKLHFFDDKGRFHLRPFVYNLKLELDPKTWKRIYTEDKSRRFPVYFFVRGWEYKPFGIPCRLHFFGVQKGGAIHLLGSDAYGRDLGSRILLGGRVSLLIALLGATLSAFIGSMVGTISAYYGGIIDMILQRIVEFLQCFPQLPLWMALSIAIPPTWSSLYVFIAIMMLFGLLSWTTLAREVRGKVLSLREQEFVLSAKEAGASDARVIFKYLLPNCLSHIIVVLTITIPWLILAESTLSFLGLGLQPPMVSWGVLLQKAQNLQTLGRHPWIAMPGIFIVITVLGFNFLGDGLRDAADPYSHR
ncbi:ABC transporter permease [Candidatus Aerophobetes bacterium]|uniref:ABC transporter permease n=1 Tax=Aerophobetes bacterium TaxID=2030807 RepID=A0A497E5P8_UNCAE|nr:MAG: ABC transporter permease [Candidatus Aerophobetes bacterium]